MEIIDEGFTTPSPSSPLSSDSSAQMYRLFDSNTSIIASGGESSESTQGYDKLMSSLLYKMWLLNWNYAVTIGLSIFTILAIVATSLILPDSSELVPMLNLRG